VFFNAGLNFVKKSNNFVQNGVFLYKNSFDFILYSFSKIIEQKNIAEWR